MTSAMEIVKEGLATFLHFQFWFPAHDSRQFSLGSLPTLQVHSPLKLKIWIFSLITYFRYHVTESVLRLVRTQWCGTTNCSTAMSKNPSLGAEWVWTSVCLCVCVCMCACVHVCVHVCVCVCECAVVYIQLWTYGVDTHLLSITVTLTTFILIFLCIKVWLADSYQAFLQPSQHYSGWQWTSYCHDTNILS